MKVLSLRPQSNAPAGGRPLAWRAPRARSLAAIVALAAVALAGCATAPAVEPSAPPIDVRFSQFILSPGDELRISVYKHDDLTRDITIPPDGVIFFPGVGEVDTTGKGVRAVRASVADGLSVYREQAILPGDTISISVFLHAEYTRQLVVPSDSRIFVPQVGEIDVSAMSLSALRRRIAEGLSAYVVDPQVMVDIVELKSPTRIVDPQVTVELVGMRGQRMYVLGEVRSPGAYVIDGRMTLIDVVSLAGGFSPDANTRSVLLARPQGPGRPRSLTLVSVDQYLGTGEPEHNPVIQSGDLVYVHTSFIANAGRFFGNLSRIIAPMLDLESGYWIGQNILAGPTGSRNLP